MSCQRCKSDRLMSINGKTSDMFSMNSGDKEMDGYVPTNLFFGQDCFGDYISLTFCLDCGQIQAAFPVSRSTVDDAFEE